MMDGNGFRTERIDMNTDFCAIFLANVGWKVLWVAATTKVEVNGVIEFFTVPIRSVDADGFEGIYPSFCDVLIGSLDSRL